MGLFKTLFGTKKEKPEEEKLPWIALTDSTQLKELREKSFERPQLIFKHSTTCGISRMVLRTFKGQYREVSANNDLYYLDLHQHRAVSNETATFFGVVHQSPQLLIVRNGEISLHASHGGINDLELGEHL